jgi:hypothetical protein
LPRHQPHSLFCSFLMIELQTQIILAEGVQRSTLNVQRSAFGVRRSALLLALVSAPR